MHYHRECSPLLLLPRQTRRGPRRVRRHIDMLSAHLPRTVRHPTRRLHPLGIHSDKSLRLQVTRVCRLLRNTLAASSTHRWNLHLLHRPLQYHCLGHCLRPVIHPGLP